MLAASQKTRHTYYKNNLSYFKILFTISCTENSLLVTSSVLFVSLASLNRERNFGDRSCEKAPHYKTVLVLARDKGRNKADLYLIIATDEERPACACQCTYGFVESESRKRTNWQYNYIVLHTWYVVRHITILCTENFGA